MSKSRYLLAQIRIDRGAIGGGHSRRMRGSKRLLRMISKTRRGRVKPEPCGRRKSEPIRAKFARWGA